MPSAPVHRLKLSEIRWLGRHRCKHGHTYLEHWKCYLKEKPKQSPIEDEQERVGFFDIESELEAEWSYMFSYGILCNDTGKVYGRVLTPKEILSGKRDGELCKELMQDFKNFDRLVVYYGKSSARRHDLPYVRTRCLKYGLDFPKYRDMWVTDLYDIVKAKMKLTRNRMVNACRVMGIEGKNYPVNPDIWQDAKIGDKKALEYIWKHNVEDLHSTRELWLRIKDFAPTSKTSV